MGCYTIKNWKRFQHYSKRKPPWIKFYTEVIEEFDKEGKPNDIFFLSDSAKLTLVLAWLLASHFEGHVPDRSEEWYAHRLGIRGVNLKELIDKGFIDASNVAIKDAQGALSPETETERETEKEKKRRGRAPAPPFVKPTLEEIRTEVETKGHHISPEEFLDHYVSNGWMVGKTPMKDWRAALRTWERRWAKDHPGVVVPAPSPETVEATERALKKLGPFYE